MDYQVQWRSIFYLMLIATKTVLGLETSLHLTVSQMLIATIIVLGLESRKCQHPAFLSKVNCHHNCSRIGDEQVSPPSIFYQMLIATITVLGLETCKCHHPAFLSKVNCHHNCSRIGDKQVSPPSIFYQMLIATITVLGLEMSKCHRQPMEHPCFLLINTGSTAIA